MPSYREVYSGPRASGRTHRMVMALPERAVVVVPNTAMRSHVRSMIERLREPEFNDTTYVVIVNNDVGIASLRCMNRPIFVDHSFWEQRDLTHSQARQLEELIERQVLDARMETPSPLEVQGYPPEFRNVRYVIANLPMWLRDTSTERSGSRRPARFDHGPAREEFTGPEAEDL
jgi:hypothetical protein